MYATHHSNESPLLFDSNKMGRINYVVWSDVFICPNCGRELVFYDVAYDDNIGKVKDEFTCSCCVVGLKKRECQRAQEKSINQSGELKSHGKQVPVLINYVYGGKKYTKKPDQYDMDLIEKIDSLTIPYWFPNDTLPDGGNTQQPIASHNFTSVDEFYTKRNLYVLSCLNHYIGNSPVRIAFQAMNPTLSSKLVRYNMGNRGNGPLNGTLYIASLTAEADIIKAFRGKVNDFIKVYGLTSKFEGAMCNTASSTDLKNIPANAIDYIFVDPPFGANINYSELSFIWEAWLKVKTSTSKEAIMNSVQGKGLLEYQNLMTECFAEFFRVLKPNRWMTVEFHNSKNSVWNSIQESLSRVGFIIADIRTLDGNTPCTGLGRLTGSGVEVETRSHKMVVLKNFANKDSLIERYGLLEYPKYYLPKDYDYLICDVGDSLDIKGENVMTHGGISLDEVVVPFIIARTEDYHG